MQTALYQLKKKVAPLLMAFLFLLANVASTVALSMINTQTASAAPLCSNDSAGANDEPGQKDLTRMCIDSATGQISWNWDELSVSGANTLDACALFDTDGDGFVNRSLCISTTDGVTFTKVIYVCSADNRVDRCAGADTGSPATSTCSLAVTATQPFGSGASSPNDLTATCTPTFADAGGGVLMDVCSYPSGQPNSDPSDCVMYRDNSARIEVRKVVSPTTDPGLFNLRIGSTTYATNVGNGGTTGEIVLTSGSITVSEIAGTNTNLANYTTTVSCRDANGTGAVVGTGSPTGATSRQLAFTAADASDIVCIFTNTRQAGTIQVIKNVDNNGDGVIDQTGTTDWNWNINGAGNYTTGSTQSVNVGSHTVSEVQKPGYSVTASSCTGETAPTTPTTSLTVNVASNENVVCTFTNTRDTGFITINKVVAPSNDTGLFNLQVDGTTAGTGANVGNGGTTGQVRVVTGTHSAGEVAGTATDLANYSSSYVCLSNQQQIASGSGTVVANINVTKDANIVCTFTNTKYSKLTIIKDAVPNDPQDFLFNASGLGTPSFSLDDDSDATLSNTKTFTNLLPNTYTVNEDLSNLPNWSNTGLVCTGSGVSYSKDGSLVAVNLSAGQDITCTYTNTKKAGISGYKFNDVNGNGVWDAGEPVLDGWTIFIDANDNGMLDDGEHSYVTADGGLYYFNNLLPGAYEIFEQLQDGWTQTLGVGSVTLEPGDQLEDQNFGNYGQGTITVKKNVDNNDDGVVDSFNVTDWTWDLTPQADYGTPAEENIATGSIRTVGAGTYTIHEDQKTNYHFESLVCDGQKVTQSETATITVSAGQNVVCTYTNARDMGTIKVIKQIEPATDLGKFNLLINGEVKATAVGDEGTTGVISVPTGEYTVSETAGNDDTLLSDYIAEISGDCDKYWSVTVAKGENKVCTITNTKKAKLTVVKQTWPGNDPQDFNFTVNQVFDEEPIVQELSLTESETSLEAMTSLYDFVLDTDGSSEIADTKVITGLTPGDYSVEESATEGWDLEGLTCYNTQNESLVTETTNPYVELTLGAGADVTCVYNNVKRGKITIIKDAGPNAPQAFTFNHNIDESGEFQLVDDGSNVLNKKTFSNVRTGYYGITEQDVDGWRLADFACDNWDNEEIDRFIAPLSSRQSEYDNYIYVYPGEEVTCTFKNEQTVLFLEKSNNRPNPTTVGDQVTYTLEVSIPEGAADLSEVVVTDLPPQNFRYVAGSWTAYSSVRGNLKLAGVTTEPTYGSPGQWQLGNMVDGEVVTLTYLADILAVVSPGTYPDIAFASGFTDDEEIVYDNLSVSDTPFVTTSVTVNKPTPVVVVNKLVNTGNNFLLFMIVPLMMIVLTALGFQTTRRYSVKGGK